MNKRIVFSVFVLTLVIVGPQTLKADDGPQLWLEIDILKEKKGEDVVFSVKGATLLHGERFVSERKLEKGEREKIEKLQQQEKDNKEEPDWGELGGYDYILETYSAKKKLLAEYLISSVKVIFWDRWSADGKIIAGGVKVKDKKIIDLWLEYDKAEPISFLRLIDYKGKETEFLPVVITKEEKKE